MEKFRLSEIDSTNISLRLNSLSEKVTAENAYDGVAVTGFSRCGRCGGAYNGNGCARNSCNGWD